METSGSGDLAIPALSIGWVPAGSIAANSNGQKNHAIERIEWSLLLFVGADWLKSFTGLVERTARVAVSTRVPAIMAIAAMLAPTTISVANKPNAAITTVAAPAAVPIQARRGRLIRSTAPY